MSEVLRLVTRVNDTHRRNAHTGPARIDPCAPMIHRAGATRPQGMGRGSRIDDDAPGTVSRHLSQRV